MKNLLERIIFGTLLIVIILITVTVVRHNEKLNEKAEAETLYFQTQTEYQKLQIQYQKDIMETQKKIDEQMNQDYMKHDGDCHH